MRLAIASLILAVSALTAWFLARAPRAILGELVVAREAGAAGGPEAAVDPADAGADATRLELPQPHPLTSAVCPDGMLFVTGEHCALAGTRGCRVEPRALSFCMDRFEYPNQRGVLPAVMLRFDQAQKWCAMEGKRLCSEAEWTFACQSVRRRSSCQTGLLERTVPVERLWEAEHISSEIAKRDGRRRSAPSACVNAFGVFDLLGNVQEWVLRPTGEGDGVALLKGGPYNQRVLSCDKALQITQPWSRYPHTGFRCCTAPLVEVPAGHRGQLPKHTPSATVRP